MIKSYLLSAFLLTFGLAKGQVLENSFQNFQGVYYGDIAVADLNGDQTPDIILTGAKPEYTGFSTKYNNDNGSFFESQIPDFPQLLYSSVAIADLNNDGRNDIIITGTNASATPQETVFEIFMASPSGGFVKKQNVEIAGANNGSIQVADFNGDGKKDILVNGNSGQPTTKIYFQLENGTFEESNVNLMGSFYSATKVFDANGDGKLDILITGFSANYIPETKLYINSGLGEFTEKISGLPQIYFSSIDAADIDGDGDIDILLAGMDMNAIYTLQIYLNDGTGNFTASANTFLGTSTGTAKFVDYDNDGLLDVFSMGTTADNGNTAQLYKNTGNLNFQLDALNSNAITALNMGKAVWFDADGDGDQDLLTMGFDGAIGITKLYTNTTIGRTCGEPGINPGDLGCITFNYGGTSVTYTTVRGSDGNVWLQQNLGSSKVAEQINDETSYGDIFQWGRWDDGHQKRNSTTAAIPTPNNPLGVAANTSNYYTGTWWSPNNPTDKWEAATPTQASDINGCDPCKAIGQGWKIPNEAEWAAIVLSENIANPTSAITSNLKLPGTGYRSNTNGNYTFVGQRGYYWSSTPSSTGGKYLYIGSISANASAGAPRGQGAALRCMKYPQASPTYCNIGIEDNDSDYIEPITYVGFANISKTSPATIGGTPVLEDFTDIIGNVTAGQTYDLVVKGNTAGNFERNYIRVYMDWNQNGIFETEESYAVGSIYGSTGVDEIAATVAITIPQTALLGNTRMRIVKDYEEDNILACNDIYFGQAEDYTLNIERNLGTGNFEKNSFKVYPNPSSDKINIQSDLEIESAVIYNQFGQLLLSQKTSQIDISNLATGIYILKIKFENGQTATQKIIKK